MNNTLPENLLSKLSEFVAARMALHFPRSRWTDLERMTRSAAKEFGATDEKAFIEWLLSSPLTREQIELLASHLTIGETYFWREHRVFEALGDTILPELIRARERGERRLRIWSAGCATGEEPYSIAIALRRVLPSPDDWNVTILATDINPQMLRKAATAEYGEWSFRNVPPWLKEEYFRLTKDRKRKLIPEIRKMVTFAYLNLAEDIYPSPLNHTNAMDVIFCRNVLMYFAPERVRLIGKGLYRSLVEGGWLIVGSSELSQLLFPQFAPVHFPGAIVYQNGPQTIQPTAALHLECDPAHEPSIPQPLKSVAEVDGLTAPVKSSPRNLVPHIERASIETTASIKVENQEERASHSMVIAVRTLANQGRLVEALALCEKAISAEKLEHRLHYLRATILQELNQEGEAIVSLKRVLYIDPDFVLAHFALGNLAMRQGNIRTGRKCFENVLALLAASQEEAVLPESEGLTAGRFREIIHATMQMGALA